MAKSRGTLGYLLKSEEWRRFSIQTYSDGTFGYTNPRGSVRGFSDQESAKAAAREDVHDDDDELRIQTRNTAEMHLSSYISKTFSACAQEIDEKFGGWARKQYKEAAGIQASRAQVRDLTATLARMASRSTEMVIQHIDGYVPQMMSEAANVAEYAIEDGTTLSPMFALVDTDTIMALAAAQTTTIPRCVSNTVKTFEWDKDKIEDALTRSIAMGESIEKCSKRLRGVVESNRAVAVRNARTMVTAAMSAGDVVAYTRAAEAGIKIKMQWLAALDDRTRHSHRVCDGEVRSVGEKFSNGLRWPGDVNGSAAEVMNCRCTTVAIIDDTAYTGKRASKLNDMSYDEWKAKHASAKQDEAPNSNQTSWPLIDPDRLDASEQQKRDELRSALFQHYKPFSYLPNGDELLLLGREFGEYVASTPTMKTFSTADDELFAVDTVRSMLANADDSVARRMYRDYLAGAYIMNSVGGAYYNPVDAKARMSLEKVFTDSDSKAKCDTLFHECGHWLDHQLGGGTTSNKEHNHYMSDVLGDAMKQDWANWRDAQGRKRDADWDTYDDDTKNSLTIAYLRKEHPKGRDTYIEWGDVSDMIECVTHSPFPLYMGHGVDYYDDVPNPYSEFFAEYMSAQIANKKSLKRIREIFPTTCTLLDTTVAARLDELDGAYAKRVSETTLKAKKKAEEEAKKKAAEEEAKKKAEEEAKKKAEEEAKKKAAEELYKLKYEFGTADADYRYGSGDRAAYLRACAKYTRAVTGRDKFVGVVDMTPYPEVVDTFAKKLAAAPNSTAKKLFDQMLGAVQYIEPSDASAAYYNPALGAITMSFDRKDYAAGGVNAGEDMTATFFHESGHLLDHILRRDDADRHLSEGIRDIANSEWEDYCRRVADAQGKTVRSRESLMAIGVDAIRKQTGWSGSARDPNLSELSDMVEAASGVRSPLSYGHGTTYFKEEPRNQDTEFFAEYISVQVTNPESLKWIRKIFPATCAEVDRRVESVLTQINLEE